MKRMMAVLAVLGACTTPAPAPDTGPGEILAPETAAGTSAGTPAIPEDVTKEALAIKELETCGADVLQGYVGQPLDSILDKLGEDSRVVPWGGLVSQDYLPKRLNVDLGEKGNIARIWCG